MANIQVAYSGEHGEQDPAHALMHEHDIPGLMKPECFVHEHSALRIHRLWVQSRLDWLMSFEKSSDVTRDRAKESQDVYEKDECTRVVES